MISSIRLVLAMVECHCSMGNPVAEPFLFQLPVGMVYQWSEMPLIRAAPARSITTSVQL